MREIISTFDKGFFFGLPTSKSLYTSVEHLSQCYNLIPTKEGLCAREVVYNPTEDLQYIEWNWPVLFILGRYKLVFTKNAVYSLDAAWELEQLATFEWGSIPHVSDFLDTVVWSSVNGQWIYNGKTVSKNVGGASFKTCCAFRGQLIVGNCTLPKGNGLNNGTITENVSVGGKNVVAWSKIGTIDWTYGFANEVGWAEMPWSGEVLALLPLGKEVVVYGSNGTVKLTMTDSPVVTFGIQDYGDIGLLNPNCVAGDFSSHVFLGTDYNLYRCDLEKAFTGEGKVPTYLGYQDFMRKLKDPIVSFDPSKKHWWIGDKDRCFILTETGLGEASITPTGLARIDGYLYGYVANHGVNNAIVETSILSLNNRGIKTLMAVEADIQASGIPYGIVHWRTKLNEEFRVNKAIRLDPRGAFFPVTSGTEFKVGFIADDFTNFYISKLWLHHKNTDKHFSRGGMNVGRPTE